MRGLNELLVRDIDSIKRECGSEVTILGVFLHVIMFCVYYYLLQVGSKSSRTEGFTIRPQSKPPSVYV